jgi:hypothetical protein
MEFQKKITDKHFIYLETEKMLLFGNKNTN